jgi:hypothetical protein
MMNASRKTHGSPGFIPGRSAVSGSTPLAAKRFLLIIPWLQPVRHAAFFLAAAGALTHF